MADPVSIVGLVASILQLADTALRIGKGLHEYRERYGQAGRTLKTIIVYCNAVNSSISMIKDWIEKTVSKSPTREQQVESLGTMIGEFLEMMGGLETEVDNLLGKDTNTKDLRFKTKAKFAWNERTMKEHLEEINYLASALHLLLDATKLSVHDSQRLLENLADNAASINSTRRSLLFTDPDGIPDLRFAFDDLLLSSHVYRKTHLSPQFLQDNDGPLMAPSIDQEVDTLWYTADDDISSDGTALRRAQSRDTLRQRTEEESLPGGVPPHVEPALLEPELVNPWRTKTCLDLNVFDKQLGFQLIEILTTMSAKIAEIEHLHHVSPPGIEQRPLWHYFDYFEGHRSFIPIVIFLGKFGMKAKDIEPAYREAIKIDLPPSTTAKGYERKLLINVPDPLLPSDGNADPLHWKEHKFYRDVGTRGISCFKPVEELWARTGVELPISDDLPQRASRTLVTIARNGTSSIEGWRLYDLKKEPLFDKSVNAATREELLESDFTIFSLHCPPPSSKDRRTRLRHSIAGALGIKSGTSPQQSLAYYVRSAQDFHFFDIYDTTSIPKRVFTYNYAERRDRDDGPDLPTLLKDLVDLRRRREAYDPERWRKYVEAG